MQLYAGKEALNPHQSSKNGQIARTRQETILRHRGMDCRTYELKIDRSHLSREAYSLLCLLFLEAKWFYNAFIAAMRSGEGFTFNYKRREVSVKVKDGFEVRRIMRLSSQMRQEIIDRAKDNLRGLSQLRRNGHRVGRLRFVGHVNSIPLKQYGVTYRLDAGRVWLQGIGRWLKVRGANQIPKDAELTSATLIMRNCDFFIHVTVYQPKATMVEHPRHAIGVDSGVKTQLVFSNGVALEAHVPLTRRLKRLHRQLSRRKKPHGRNRFEANIKLNREYDRISGRRLDFRRKIVSYLIANYACVATQDDCIAGWQRLWGRRIASTGVGGIMSDLRNKPHTPVIVDRFTPTTKRCCRCGAVKGAMSLDERVYWCDTCGLMMDRDLNAAVNVWSQVPMECRESTPVDTKAATEMLRYFNSIPCVWHGERLAIRIPRLCNKVGPSASGRACLALVHYRRAQAPC
jgi:putative transposase